MAHRAGAYPGFCGVKRNKWQILSLPGQDASSSQVTFPSSFHAGTHLTPGWSVENRRKVSFQRTQR